VSNTPAKTLEKPHFSAGAAHNPAQSTAADHLEALATAVADLSPEQRDELVAMLGMGATTE